MKVSCTSIGAGREYKVKVWVSGKLERTAVRRKFHNYKLRKFFLSSYNVSITVSRIIR